MNLLVISNEMELREVAQLMKKLALKEPTPPSKYPTTVEEAFAKIKNKSNAIFESKLFQQIKYKDEEIITVVLTIENFGKLFWHLSLSCPPTKAVQVPKETPGHMVDLIVEVFLDTNKPIKKTRLGAFSNVEHFFQEVA